MAKIVVFGAGDKGKSYVSDPYIRRCTIAILDNNESLWGACYNGIPVLNPSEIKNLEYDYIVVSIADTNIFNIVKKQLVKLDVSANKIISCYDFPEVIIYGFERQKSTLTFFSLDHIGAYIDDNELLWGKRYCGIPIIPLEKLGSFAGFGSIVIANYEYERISNKLISYGVSKEKIRYCGDLIKKHESSARFLWIKNYAHWISEQNLQGNIAECGVCNGNSAKFINEYFPNRKLYLFDTFEGFVEQDIAAEHELNNDAFLNGMFNNVGMYSNTSIDIVMSKMNYPENVIIKKGYFPDSAKNIDDKFCFVNLDMDLYQPMLAALNFFWDKMIDGGCIVLHDYFHPKLPGVAQAVADFEKELNIKLHKTVIGDDCSIAILK